MDYALIRTRIYGIKSINKEITLDYSNATIKKDFNNQKSNVKAIYGTNGVGKSAIINAIDLYLSIVKERNFVLTNQRMLENIINKQTNNFYIENTFRVSYDNLYFVYSHYIEISKVNNEYKITHEIISEIKGKTINLNKKVLLETVNGLLVTCNTEKNESTVVIEEVVKNLLLDNSIISILSNEFIKSFSIETDFYLEKDILYVTGGILGFVYNTLVYVEETDKHSYIDTNKLQELKKIIKTKENISFSSLLINEDIINIDDFSEYTNSINKLTKFIKIFKPSIKNITIDNKLHDKKIHIRKIINYNDYFIDLEYESTGIKKLVKLFNCFDAINKGKIVFIDELDANLHDVYLSKLIEYVGGYAKGQLIFTSHNTGPMIEIQYFKNSINFLTQNQEIVEWIRNGTYKAQDQYRKGMIKDNPFNINDFDFYEVFEDEECN